MTAMTTEEAKRLRARAEALGLELWIDGDRQLLLANLEDDEPRVEFIHRYSDDELVDWLDDYDKPKPRRRINHDVERELDQLAYELLGVTEQLGMIRDALRDGQRDANAIAAALENVRQTVDERCARVTNVAARLRGETPAEDG